MKFIDTHSHLYLDQFKEDQEEVMARAKEVLEAVYLPNIDCSTVEVMHALENKYPNFCYAMMGLHPCSVKANFKEKLDNMLQFLKQRPYVAIGEIGTDLYWDKTTIREQEVAFRTQLNWAKEMNLPVVIHSRDSLDLNIKIVEEEQNGSLRGIFHCFNGTLEQSKAIIDLDFILGVGGVLTFKNGGMREIYSEIPLEKIVLETDAPYLTPTPFRGKRNESAYIPIIAEVLAEVKQKDIIEVAKQTNKNARGLYHPN